MRSQPTPRRRDGDRMAELELFFDCGSPWTYLAFEGVGPVLRETGGQLRLRPILVGGVFNAVNQSVYQARAHPIPQKAAYHRKDLADWARCRGLQIGWPKVFPVRSVRVMRGCLVAEESGLQAAFARRAFQAYWRDLEDISQPAVLERVATDAGLDPRSFLARIEAPEIKQALAQNTQELIDRGGFGSPTFFVDRDDLYFGQDRLELIRHALLERAS